MDGWLAWLAAPMEQPPLFGSFHILVAGTGVLAAAFLAWALRNIPERTLWWILGGLGILLAAGEILKQFFLYAIVYHQQYAWWYFPFQLCSLPLYFCPFLPLLRKGPLREALLTFLMSFNLLGGLAALAFPSDLLHPYRFWTWHGFLWHIVLVFLGLLAGLHRTAVPERSPRQFTCALPVWGISVILATVLNILLHGKGEVNLFYISPYYRSGQPVIASLEKAWGLPAGIAVYLTAMVLGALLVYGMVGAWRARYLRKLS